MIHLGHHTGKNISEILYSDNNASTNSRMALELQSIVCSFNMKEKLLGCIAHVINLGAKAGLAVLGSIHDEIGTEISIADPETSPHIIQSSRESMAYQLMHSFFPPTA
ncbi:hypothetical protein VP01_3784g1 [Puccinia sorghi]|uniref:Uncharacterized protein n=1 Tax=Puccinia sorghi TaxID=27349 RepID=A0A0L6UTL0_9BASI|nr:hypothetical protein VP01_3784g1 [Puccinia sorghi]